MKNYRVHTETLTPIHIGAGERLNPMGFFISGDRFYTLNEDVFFRELNEDESLRNVYIGYINKIDAEGRRDASLTEFLADWSELTTKLKEKAPYSLEYRVIAKRDILTFIKDSQRHIYIPGSSIKGAVRTALAFSALDENEELRSALSERDLERKNPGEEVEILLFRCGKEEMKKGLMTSDQKFDLLKFLRFTDSNSKKPEDKFLGIRNYGLGSVTKEGMRYQKRRGPWVLEAVLGGYEGFSSYLTVDSHFLVLAKQVKLAPEWSRLEEKFEKVFKSSLDEITSETLDEKIDAIIERICNCCNNHSVKVLKKYKDLWKTGSSENERTVAKKLQELIDETNNLGTRETILNLGFGSGWLGTTVTSTLDDEVIGKIRRRFQLGLVVYEFSCPICRQTVKFQATKVNRIHALRGKRGITGERRGPWRCGKCNKELSRKDVDQAMRVVDHVPPFPKTQRVIVEHDVPTWPLGWVKLRFEEI